MTSHRRKVYLWCLLVLALLTAAVGSCGNAYLRLGTNVVGNFPSPDGKWDAVLMVRNGGAMTDFSTQISVVGAHGFWARQFALCRPGNLFIADSNHGTVSSGDRGQIDVVIVWKSTRQVTITYPEDARVFKRLTSVAAVSVEYVTSGRMDRASSAEFAF